MKKQNIQSEPDKGVLVPQPRIGEGFFAVSIMLITTFQWITLDMYLPALPILKEVFNVTEAQLNVSLNAGIITCAVGTLVSGFLSDRFGRKGLLLAGMFTSAACSFACAFSQGIVFLTIMRGLGGLGVGFILTITTAQIRDTFSGKRFQTTMTVLQSIAAVGPVFAPSLGSFIIDWLSWRYIFVFLGAATVLTAIPMVIADETLPPQKRFAENMGQVVAEAGSILKQRFFIVFMAVMSLVTIPTWAYISVSSYIYITQLGLSNMQYSLFYGIGAVFSMTAPLVYVLLSRFLRTTAITPVTIILAAVGGGILLATGGRTGIIVLISAFPLLMAEGIIRPMGIVVILERYSHAAGTASALINFILNMIGVVGTTVATLSWSTFTSGVGTISVGCAVLAAALWLIIAIPARRTGTL